VSLMHSAATIHAADKLITPHGDLNANWFSILTVEGVAVQLHTANISREIRPLGHVLISFASHWYCLSG
jgi:hypothetical protein